MADNPFAPRPLSGCQGGLRLRRRCCTRIGGGYRRGPIGTGWNPPLTTRNSSPYRSNTMPRAVIILKLGGAGEWLVEKHGTSRRRSWRKLHLGIDTDSGEIVAIELTRKEIDDSAPTDALLDQPSDSLASFTADGAYDQDRVYEAVRERHPDAAVIVPPRSIAAPSASAETAPTQRDLHLRTIAERGRMGWQKSSGYNLRAKVEASLGRYKR
jgi:DDE family transposase